MKELTSRQKELFEFIKQYIYENNYSPSFYEMRDYMKVNNIRGIQDKINALEKKGYLKRMARCRAIKILKEN